MRALENGRQASGKPKADDPDRPSLPSPTRSQPARAESPTRRSTYAQAVALYEEAIQALQRHEFEQAADRLRLLVTGFPDERELCERSRTYLALCDRHLKPLTANPSNTSERLYAATLALNAGQPDQARVYLERILQDEPTHDQALYMLAVAYAAASQTADAIRYLRRAIEANPENRAMARTDPDLDALRRDAGVAALLDSVIARTGDPRPARRR